MTPDAEAKSSLRGRPTTPGGGEGVVAGGSSPATAAELSTPPVADETARSRLLADCGGEDAAPRALR